jgi:antitoxin CptB
MNRRALGWRCRRGLLELDIILVRFLETRYDQLSAVDQAAFQEWLKESDADLWAWIQGAPAPPQYSSLLESLTMTDCLITS